MGGLRRQKQRTVQGLAAVRAYCEQVFSAETGTAVVGGDYSNGVLTVNCSAAALVQELTQFHREALLTAVRAAVPETARLRIQPA
ncbi:MAG: hypothetical protein ACREJ2_09590 [Planctomycetota bacterium]